MRLYACSTNPGKLKEFALAAKKCGREDLTIEALPGLQSIVPPQETGSTFEENASLKAAYYSKFCTELVLADDSGLEVHALADAPGVHSARFAGPGASKAANNDLLLRKLERESDRRAQFVCVIAVARSGQVLHTARGYLEGEILRVPRGTNGFGYDPLFYYAPFECTLAEVSADRKFAVSHRGNALRATFHWLFANGESLKTR